MQQRHSNERGSESGAGYGDDDRFASGGAPAPAGRGHRAAGGINWEEARDDPRAHVHDPDYHEWRERQLRALDDDYRAWRRERYQKFADEFTQWRQAREAQEAPAPPGADKNKNS